jgi:3-dehydroquinate synthase
MTSQKEISTEYIINLETVRRCPIIIGDGIMGRLGEYFDLSAYSGIALLTDTTVQNLYGQRVTGALEATGKKVSQLTLPVGEKTKSLSTAERGYQFLLDSNIDRKGLMCALGGGVVGDVAGYIAASYLRGIDYIQLPTTLLAQVDSSVGGKVGVNFGGKKNMVGSFYQPSAIISDVALLKSLPPAEMRNGLAEVIKYGLAMDEELFGILEKKEGNEFTPAELKDIVRRCCRLKAAVVEADETERTGKRAILNFGHTIGHALEAAARFQGRSHGEAVAIGMAAAARMSAQVGRLDQGKIPQIENLLSKFGLPIYCHGINPDDLIETTRFDKKTTKGQTGWVLLEGVGQGVTNQLVEESIIKKALREICR